MNVLILGGGNIGTSLAGEISRVKGYDVTIYTSKADEFLERIGVVDDERNLTFKSGAIVATKDLESAAKDANLILCTFPAQLRKNVIERISPIIASDAILGFVPGYGGAELYCQNIINKGVTIFGLQKVPYISRTHTVGHIAGIMSRKRELHVATIPQSKCGMVAKIIEDMLLIKTIPLKNYMAATLLPGNPLLHTSCAYGYLKDYKLGDVFSEQIYCYQTWTDFHSEVLCSYSNEMEEICNNLPIDLSEVLSIQEYYEAPTPKDVTIKFHSIPSFQSLVFPMIKQENGYVPDFSSRFYTEDIPFGVCILKGLSLMAGVQTPTIDTILKWYKGVTGKEYFKEDGTFGKDIQETAIPQLFGIKTKQELAKFYLR